MTLLRRSGALLLALLAVGSTGCDGFSDFVDDPVGDFEVQLQVSDVEYDLGVSVDVAAGEPQIEAFTIDEQLDVEVVQSISDIRIRPQDLVYTPSAERSEVATRGTAAASGTISAMLGIKYSSGVYVPMLSATATVEGGQVTSVETIPFSFTSYGQVQTIVESMGYQFDTSMTVDEAQAQVVAALNEAFAGFYDFVITTSTTGDLDGSLSLDQFEFDGIVTP